MVVQERYILFIKAQDYIIFFNIAYKLNLSADHVTH